MKKESQLQDLANILNGVFSQLKLSHNTLSKLPEKSWEAKARMRNNKLEINVLRDEDLLLKSRWVYLSSEIFWYEIIIPIVAGTLSKCSILSKSLIVRFNFRSENGERSFSCNALELSSNAEQISSSDGFGIMMSLMDPE